MLLGHRITQVLKHDALKHYRAIATALSNELAATAIERDLKAGLPYNEVQQLRQSGLLPLVVPCEYGGIGASWNDAFWTIRELAKADVDYGF